MLNTDSIEQSGELVQKQFNLEQQKQAVNQELENSPEVAAIVSQINLSKPETIMQFGASTAQEISTFSDSILHSLESTKVEDSGKVLSELNRIMSKFDIKDFEEEKGLFAKLAKKFKNQVEAMLAKYHTLGDDVDKIYRQLKEYEQEIVKNNQTLEEMFGKNLIYYKELEKYIFAGQKAVDELNNEVIPKFEAEANGDNMKQIQLDSLKKFSDMMEHRVYDLRLAENVALQSMPMIKSIQFSNYNLVRKINSAFVVTLPVFKQAIAQAIFLKRQQLQAQAIKALDEKTNEIILQNAQNMKTQTKLTTELAEGSFVDVQTLQTSWQTIMEGINDAKQIQLEAKQKRESDTKCLEQLKQEYSKVKLS